MCPFASLSCSFCDCIRPYLVIREGKCINFFCGAEGGGIAR